MSSNRGQFDGRLLPGVKFDEVYVTPKRELAARYAKHYRDKAGTLYRCKPIGPVTISRHQTDLARMMIESAHYTFAMIVERLRIPTLGSATYTCEKAEIVEVIGNPWAAPADVWWHAENVPSNDEVRAATVAALIRAGVPMDWKSAQEIGRH